MRQTDRLTRRSFLEQNVRRSLQIARRAYVLEQGAVALAGPAHDLAAHEGVPRLYLGL